MNGELSAQEQRVSLSGQCNPHFTQQYGMTNARAVLGWTPQQKKKTQAICIMYYILASHYAISYIKAFTRVYSCVK
jgi:hypothetical protein